MQTECLIFKCVWYSMFGNDAYLLSRTGEYRCYVPCSLVHRKYSDRYPKFSMPNFAKKKKPLKSEKHHLRKGEGLLDSIFRLIIHRELFLFYFHSDANC